MTQKEEITYSNEDSQDDFSPPACGAADKKSKIKSQEKQGINPSSSRAENISFC